MGVKLPMAVTLRVVVAEWVRPPEVEPVTVRGYDPRGVDADVVTVIVELPAPATEVGTKPTVAPVGRPLAVKLTLALNPPRAPSVTVYETLPPWTTDAELGETEIVKSVTFRVAVVVWVRLPLTPCMVMEYEPPVAPEVVMLSVALPGAATGLPVKLADTPAGSVLVTLNVTFPVKPLSAPTLMV
jgi:hypothetical protein